MVVVGDVGPQVGEAPDDEDSFQEDNHVDHDARPLREQRRERRKHLASRIVLRGYAAANAQEQGIGNDGETRVGGEDSPPAHQVGDGAADGHAQPLAEKRYPHESPNGALSLLHREERVTSHRQLSSRGGSSQVVLLPRQGGSRSRAACA